MKSTYLPNDEQIARIKKEIDLLKMQQELEAIKQKQSGATQSTKPQNSQSYESQNLQIQDSRNVNQSTQRQGTQRQDSQPKEYKVSNYSVSPRNRSGMFFGIEAGYIEAKGESLLTGIMYLDKKKGGVNYGVMLGYAYFLNSYFGARIYGSLNASHIKFDDGGTNINTLQTTLNWGMNADLIANFVALRNFDMGVYLGVFLVQIHFWRQDILNISCV